jgi:glutathione synthase/RimK-type ligase-like ATP-grasp enzyme
MKNKIVLLTDYKGNFGAKYNAVPYRSGFDKLLLKQIFESAGIDVQFVQFSEIDWKSKEWPGQIVLYTSSEEFGYFYKSFIEDNVLHLEQLGANCIPGFPHLRANNNKVYMEFLANSLGIDTHLNTFAYGTLEELRDHLRRVKLDYPVVLKKPEGAKSRGVFLVQNEKSLLRESARFQGGFGLFNGIKEILRTLKHQGYQKQSFYQKKMIIQSFIPNLKNDWKVLIYGEKVFVLNRGIKPNDFRASGSGFSYKSGSKSEIPVEVLDFSKKVYDKMNVPNLSLDIAYDGNLPYLIEFQSVYFGMATILMSEDFYCFKDREWKKKPEDISLEEIYAQSIIDHVLKIG